MNESGRGHSPEPIIIYRTRNGLRAKCGCGHDLGPSPSWDESVASLLAHQGRDGAK